MKPAWDKLMGEFSDSASALIADVDCTAAGKPLCDANGVKGFPSIKYGDPTDLQDYQGGRDYDSLKKFAEENLKPMCSPANLDLCDEEMTEKINAFMVLDDDVLNGKIEAEEAKIEGAEETFKTEVEKLQKKYQELMTEKDDAIAAVKAAGLGLMKSVRAAQAKGEADKDEL
jgi:hypothetical protein